MNNCNLDSSQIFDPLPIVSSSLSNILSSEKESLHLNDNNNKSVMSPNDVLLGKEKEIYNHSGNQRFRKLINSNIHHYMEITSKTMKSHYIDQVYAELKKLGFRFHKRRNESSISSYSDGRNDDNGRNDDKEILWHEINNKEARLKVSHALRDGVREVRRTKERRAQRRKQKQKQLLCSNAYNGLQNFSSPKKVPLSLSCTFDCDNSKSVPLLDIKSPLSYSREKGIEFSTKTTEDEQRIISPDDATSSPSKKQNMNYNHPYLEYNTLMNNNCDIFHKYPLREDKPGDTLQYDQYHQVKSPATSYSLKKKKMNRHHHSYLEYNTIMNSNYDAFHKNSLSDNIPGDILQHDKYHQLKSPAVQEKNVSFLLTTKDRQLPQQEYHCEEQSGLRTTPDDYNNNELNLERQSSIASFFSLSSADFDYDDNFLKLSPSKTNNNILNWIDRYISPISESNGKNNTLILKSNGTEDKDQEEDTFLERKEIIQKNSDNNNIHLFELIHDMVKKDNHRYDSFY